MCDPPESWYNASGDKLQFTTYERDAESGNDYALARYYDSTVARFCSADPLGGQPGDPQSWNRYAYVENDPINLTDPSGKGFLSWLADVALAIADILTGGAFLPANYAIELGQVLPGLTAFDAFARTAETVARETQPQQPQQPQQTPQQPAKRVECNPWNFTFTFVGPKEARGKTALTQKDPQVGDVAIDPRDFGYDDYYDLASRINPQNPAADTPAYPDSADSFSKIQREQQELKDANITITLTGNAPKGLPSDGPYSAVDVIHPKQHNTVDLYRTKTQAEADKLGRKPAKGRVSFTPTGRVKCPG
jgi:RHS repeat-associated protein